MRLVKHSLAKIQYLLKSLRFLKVKSGTNLLLLGLSYLLSIIVKRPTLWGKPVFLSIEPVNYCNLKCPECPTGNGEMIRPKQAVPINLCKKIIDETQSYLSFINFYFQGEPFLHPDAADMIKYADEHNIYTATSTNGHFIDESLAEKIVLSGLQKIIISLDGYDQQSYEQYRKQGDYSKAISAIRLIADAKHKHRSSTPFIHVQTLLLSTTQNHLKEIKQAALGEGANKVVFKTAQFYDLANRNKLLPKPDKSRYSKTKDGDFQLDGKMLNRCWRAWSNPVICSDGQMAPCCFDKNADYAYGTTAKESLGEVWQNRDKMHTLILSDKSKIEMCHNCPYGRR